MVRAIQKFGKFEFPMVHIIGYPNKMAAILSTIGKSWVFQPSLFLDPFCSQEKQPICLI